MTKRIPRPGGDGEDTPEPGSRPACPATAATVLAFDFGEKRIGVAVGELALGIPHPLTVIAAEDNRSRFAGIAALIAEWRPQILVVGVASHADGSAHEVGRLSRRFAQRLEGRFGIRTVLVDEYLTSGIAEMHLRESGIAPRRHRAAVDAVAAQEILRTFFAKPAAPKSA